MRMMIASLFIGVAASMTIAASASWSCNPGNSATRSLAASRCEDSSEFEYHELGEASHHRNMHQNPVTKTTKELMKDVEIANQALLDPQRASVPPYPHKKGAMDWSKCISEGGSKNCAKCDFLDGGGLPCPATWNITTENISKAMFGAVYAGGMDMQAHQKEQGLSGKLTGSTLKGIALVTRRFPNLITQCDNRTQEWGDDSCNKTVVYTKSQVVKPQYSERNVGVFLFKRIVMHYNQGWKSDTYSAGVCRVCAGGEVPFSWTTTKDTTEAELQAWFSACFLNGKDCSDELQADEPKLAKPKICETGEMPPNKPQCADSGARTLPAHAAFKDVMSVF